MEQDLMNLMAAVGTLVGAFVLEGAKKYTTLLDGKVGNLIKPIQPFIAMAAGVGLPYLTQALGVGTVDPNVFVAAPVTTVVAVSAREALERLRKKDS